MRTSRLAISALAVVLLAGCAAAGGPTDLPEGVSVAVYQTRTDVGPRKLEVSVTNQTGGVLRITGARFVSDQFAEPAVWQKDSTSIPDGATVDLPVQLSEPNCDAVEPTPTVELDFVLSDGTVGSAITVADDRIDRLPEIMVEDCLAAAVADVATLTIDAPPRPGVLDGNPVFELDIDVAPSGSPGSLTLVSVGSTTLLMPADRATGLPVTDQSIDVTIEGGDAPSTVTLLLTAGRCDPHAIQEDKRGTIMPIEVIVDGTPGRAYIASADAVRGAIYDVVTRACAF